jgi:hypothetical protein
MTVRPGSGEEIFCRSAGTSWRPLLSPVTGNPGAFSSDDFAPAVLDDWEMKRNIKVDSDKVREKLDIYSDIGVTTGSATITQVVVHARNALDGILQYLQSRISQAKTSSSFPAIR